MEHVLMLISFFELQTIVEDMVDENRSYNEIMDAVIKMLEESFDGFTCLVDKRLLITPGVCIKVIMSCFLNL